MIKRYNEYINKNMIYDSIAFLIDISTNYASSTYYDYFKFRVSSIDKKYSESVLRFISSKLEKNINNSNLSSNWVELIINKNDCMKIILFMLKHNFKYDKLTMTYKSPMTYQQLEIFLDDIIDNINKDINMLYLEDIEKHKELIKNFKIFKSYLSEDTIKKCKHLIDANNFNLI